METPAWSALLSRIVPQEADDLDALTRPLDPRRAERAGRDVFLLPGAVLARRTALKRADAVAIGLRAAAPLPDAADRAMRLAAFAAERDVEIVVLSHCDRCGLERFGFRIERVAGASEAERAACEDQIRRFWNIDLVL